MCTCSLQDNNSEVINLKCCRRTLGHESHNEHERAGAGEAETTFFSSKLQKWSGEILAAKRDYVGVFLHLPAQMGRGRSRKKNNMKQTHKYKYWVREKYDTKQYKKYVHQIAS